MADLHDSMISAIRKKYANRGFITAKAQMPGFLPDYYGQIKSKNGTIVQEVIVEVEIESTLFNEHTSHQLDLMDKFIRYKKTKKIKVDGLLVVPKTKTKVKAQAQSLLQSLFIGKCNIAVVEIYS